MTGQLTIHRHAQQDEIRDQIEQVQAILGDRCYRGRRGNTRILWLRTDRRDENLAILREHYQLVISDERTRDQAACEETGRRNAAEALAFDRAIEARIRRRRQDERRLKGTRFELPIASNADIAADVTQDEVLRELKKTL